MRKKKECKLTDRCRLLFYIRERGWAAAGPYSLCGLRETASKVAVQNSNKIIKTVVRGMKNLCRKKGEPQAYSPSLASVLYLQEGAGGSGALFPCVLRETAARATVKNSNSIGKLSVRRI